METLTFQLDQDLSPTKETQNANHLRNHDDVGRGRQSDTYLIPMPHSIAVVHYGSKMYYYVSRGDYGRWTQWYLSYGTSTPRAHSSSSLILQFPYCILILWTSAISDHVVISMLYCQCAVKLRLLTFHFTSLSFPNRNRRCPNPPYCENRTALPFIRLPSVGWGPLIIMTRKSEFF
jgi:hypothetical protein